MIDLFQSGIDGTVVPVFCLAIACLIIIISVMWRLMKVRACNDPGLKKRFWIEFFIGCLGLFLSIVTLYVRVSLYFNNQVYVVLLGVIFFLSPVVLSDFITHISEQKGKMREFNRRVEYGQG